MTVHVIPQPSERMLLRWHGGKVALAPWILQHFPPHDRYVEAFGGGAGVLLAKSPARAEIYNDLDMEIVTLFRVLRRPEDSVRLADQIFLTPFSRVEFDEAYEAATDDVEIARRLLVRSYQGFSPVAATRPTGRKAGLGINSAPGKFEPSAWTTVPERIRTVAERFRGVLVENRAAIDVLRDHDGPDTLHYVDPPYVHAVRGSSCDYRHELSDADHADLLEVLMSLRGMVVVSGYPTPLYDDRLQGWVRVSIESLTHSAKRRTECLWINPACAARLRGGRQPDLFT